ncbi:MAG: glycosyltransferase [Acetobacter sp.]|nr:glycosyltransferase [Bacteroides sp.]MCM1341541.1 glycosyltransferase [Acetobacter sp.]MCM1433618.1 glycosyltransferase [Clostridiales bacterium]
MNEKISVIIPVYKAERFLDRCVESLVNQTYENIEILLIDDGSPDKCPEMCDRWAEKDSRIKVIHKNNNGVAKARETGVENATGSYIAFVDGDDWIEKDMYEYLYRLIKSGDYQIACCSYEVVSSENDTIKNGEEKLINYGYEESVKRLYDDALWSLCFKLYPKELFDNADKINVNLSVCEDLLLNHYLFKNAKHVIVSNQKKYYYFRHPDSAVGKKISEKRIKDSMTAYQIISDDIDKSSVSFSYHTAHKISNAFMLLKQLIAEDSCDAYFEVLRNDILNDIKYIFKKENKCFFGIKQKMQVIVLKLSPALYKKIIKIIK